MTGNEMFLLVWSCGLALIALWFGRWAVYWKHKYMELRERHDRARTPWPPIQG